MITDRIVRKCLECVCIIAIMLLIGSCVLMALTDSINMPLVLIACGMVLALIIVVYSVYLEDKEGE